MVYPRAMRRRAALLAVALGILSAPPAAPAQGASPVPVIVSISPTQLPVAVSYGAFGATVTITGRNFVASSAARLDGADLTTTFVSSTQLTAHLRGFDGGRLTVFTPAPGGGTSNGVDIGRVLGGPGSTFPVISVPPGLVRFEMALVGSYQEARLQVANALTGLLAGVVSASAPFACVSGCSYGLAGGAVQDVTIRFTPQAAGTFPGVVSFSGAAGAITPVEAVAAIAPPTAGVTLSGSQFRPGQILTVGIDVENPPGNPLLRLYVGVLMPDAVTLVLLSSQGTVTGTASVAIPASMPAGDPAPAGFQLSAPAFFRFTFPPTGVAPGTYRVFVALARDGAFQDNRIGPGDIVAIDSEALTFSP